MTQGEKDLAEILSVVLQACSKQAKVNLNLFQVIRRLQRDGQIGEDEFAAFTASSQEMLNSLNDAVELFKKAINNGD